jgi:hypothetical protein
VSQNQAPDALLTYSEVFLFLAVPVQLSAFLGDLFTALFEKRLVPLDD